MLKKLIRLNLDDMGLALGVVGGFFLLIHLVTAVVLCLFDHGNSSLLLSGVVLPIVSAIVIGDKTKTLACVKPLYCTLVHVNRYLLIRFISLLCLKRTHIFL